MATFIRGSGQNRVGWVANPSHDPNGGERAVWAAHTDGSGAWRLAVHHRQRLVGGGGRGGGPELSPDGKYVVFPKDGQLYRARTARGATAAVDTGGVPFIKEWGRQSNPQWSPDGSKLAFVSTRENHAFIGVYDMKSRIRSTSSRRAWTSTAARRGRRTESGSRSFAARARRSAQQAQQGQGGIGNPAWPGGGRARQGGGARRTRQWRRWWRRRRWTAAAVVAVAADAAVTTRRRRRADGLYRAAFPGGYTLSFMVADVATGKAQEFWHNQPNDRMFGNINSITWAGDNVVFGGAGAERRVGSLLLGEHLESAAASRCC